MTLEERIEQVRGLLEEAESLFERADELDALDSRIANFEPDTETELMIYNSHESKPIKLADDKGLSVIQYLLLAIRDTLGERADTFRREANDVLDSIQKEGFR